MPRSDHGHDILKELFDDLDGCNQRAICGIPEFAQIGVIGVDGCLAFSSSTQNSGLLFNNLVRSHGQVRTHLDDQIGEKMHTQTGLKKYPSFVFLISNKVAMSMLFAAISCRKSSVRSKRTMELGSRVLKRSIRASTLKTRKKFATNIAVSTPFPPRWGVPRNITPPTEFRMESNRPSALVLAIKSAWGSRRERALRQNARKVD